MGGLVGKEFCPSKENHSPSHFNVRLYDRFELKCNEWNRNIKYQHMMHTQTHTHIVLNIIHIIAHRARHSSDIHSFVSLFHVYLYKSGAVVHYAQFSFATFLIQYLNREKNDSGCLWMTNLIIENVRCKERGRNRERERRSSTTVVYDSVNIIMFGNWISRGNHLKINDRSLFMGANAWRGRCFMRLCLMLFAKAHRTVDSLDSFL